MKIVKRNLSELHKTKMNIRRHSDRQIAEYVRSLQMFGQIRPLVVTEDGEILVGNGMFEALKSMGAESCEVYVAEGLNEAGKKKLMLADNKVYELGFTDVDVLDDIIKELNGDFDVPGYDSDLLDMLAKNPVEAGEEVAGYGTVEPVVSGEKQDSQEVSFGDSGRAMYEPPVKSADGAFIPPQEKVESPSGASGDGRPFVICPKCGEKIWL